MLAAARHCTAGSVPGFEARLRRLSLEEPKWGINLQLGLAAAIQGLSGCDLASCFFACEDKRGSCLDGVGGANASCNNVIPSIRDTRLLIPYRIDATASCCWL